MGAPVWELTSLPAMSPCVVCAAAKHVEKATDRTSRAAGDDVILLSLTLFGVEAEVIWVICGLGRACCAIQSHFETGGERTAKMRNEAHLLENIGRGWEIRESAIQSHLR